MIIGGAEDKLRKRTILKEFVTAAGGRDARVAVIPTASSLGDEIVEVYDALFRKLGAGDVIAVRPQSRDDSHRPDLVQAITSATGIFMTGGNQLKLSSIVCGTPLGAAIVAAHEAGIVVAGTSAGASIQSSHMVAFGVGGATPKQRMTQVAAGLGLVQSAVIDQHFDQRNRYGRLLMIVSQSPQLLGIGVVTGYLGAAPSLLWAASAATLIFAPLLIGVSVWLYTLVFAFSALWFAHFCLAALAALRAESAALATPPAGPVIDATPAATVLPPLA